MNGAMALAEVSKILLKERRLLELLLFKLTEEQLLLASGHARWLTAAAEEVELVLEEIGRTELARALAVSEVAEGLSLPPDPTLGQLADAAPPPFDAVFREHRDAFLALTAEVEETARANRELVHRGQSAVAQALATIAPGSAWGPADRGVERGRRSTDAVRGLVLDEVL